MTEYLPHYDPGQIRRLCGERLFTRAYELYGSGAVHALRRQGATLLAQVADQRTTYTTEVDLLEPEPLAICDCPYDYSICQHAAAVLVAWWDAPRSFKVEPEQPAPTRRAQGRPGDQGELPPWAIQASAWRRDAAKARLRTLLEAHLTMKELRAVAQANGWHLRGTLKADAVAQLAEHLSAPDEMAPIIARLNPAEQAALWAVALLDDGYGATVESVASAIQVLTGRVASGRERGESGKAAAQPSAPALLAGLAQRGLVIPEVSGWAAQALLRLPPTLGALLPPPPNWAARPARPPSSEVSAIPGATAELLYHLWSAVAARSIAPLQSGAEDWASPSWPPAKRMAGYQDMLPVPPPAPPLSERDLERLLPLVGGDRTRLLFFWALLRDLQLVVVQGNRFVAQRSAMDAFLTLDPLEQTTLLMRTWLACLRWNELDALLAQDGLTLYRSSYLYGISPQGLRQALARRRRFVVRWLTTLPNRAWTDLESFLRGLRAQWESFIYCPPHDMPWVRGESWWLGEGKRRLDYRRPEDWERGQGAFVRAILSGPPRWLGLVALAEDIAAIRHDRPTILAVRPLDLADIFWDRLGEPSPAAGPTVTPPVVDETELTVTLRSGSASGAGAHLVAPLPLERLGYIEDVTPAGVVYRLSRDAAHRAFESGATADDLLAAWEASLGEPPAGIRKAIEGWWASYAQVRVTDGLAVLETADEVTLRELLATPAFQRYILAQIGPRMAAVAPESVEPLLQEMLKKGYTPKRA